MLRNEQFKKEKKLMCHLGISFAHLRESTVTLISFPVLYEFYFFFFRPCMFCLLLRDRATQIAEKLLLDYK